MPLFENESDKYNEKTEKEVVMGKNKFQSIIC